MTHGPPPQLPPRGPERCLAERALTFAQGEAELQGVGGGGTTLVQHHNGSGYAYSSIRVNSDGASAPVSHLSGYTPYLGDERISAEEALEALGDPQLLERYEHSLEPHAAGVWPPVARPIWILSLSAAMGLMAAGIVEGADGGYNPETDTTEWGNTFVFLGSSIGALLLSIPFIWLDLGNVDEANELSARDELLVLDAEGRQAVAAHNGRRNARLAVECGIE